MANSTNMTSHAKSLGYQGTRPVLVSDGRVISHADQDWFEFCTKLREQIPSNDQGVNV